MIGTLPSSLGVLLIASAGSLNPVTTEVEVTELGAGMGFLEGPLWVGGERGLVFSDIPASKLMGWHPDSGVFEFAQTNAANGNALDAGGRIVSCSQGSRSVVQRSEDGSRVERTLVDRVDGRRFNSPNDLAIQRNGTIWFTDPPWGLVRQTVGRELPGHWVFRLDPRSGEAEAQLKEFCMPNGIALSPDERTLYVSDTGGHPSHPEASFRNLPPQVVAFALDGDGRLERDGRGDPIRRWTTETLSDGMYVDSFGRLYLTGPPGVTVWSPDGMRLGEIAIEGSTTNVTLGGADGTTLFITAGGRLLRATVAAAAPRRAPQ